MYPSFACMHVASVWYMVAVYLTDGWLGVDIIINSNQILIILYTFTRLALQMMTRFTMILLVFLVYL